MSNAGAFIITGSGSGIGLALAQKITGLGHPVFGLGRNPEKLQAAAVALANQRGSFHFHPTDLADPRSTALAVQAIRSWLELNHFELAGLVNNAGVFDRAAFHLTSDAIWERHFHGNLLSAVRLTRELYPDLQKSPGSSVLNIGSTLGVRPVANTSAYSALKAALVSFTKTLALEWAPQKIRVNCLCPGLVDTPIHAFHGHSDREENRIQAHSAQPLARMGRPEEIAEAGWFLLSPASQWTTGTVMVVDGGISL